MEHSEKLRTQEVESCLVGDQDISIYFAAYPGLLGLSASIEFFRRLCLEKFYPNTVEESTAGSTKMTSRADLYNEWSGLSSDSASYEENYRECLMLLSNSLHMESIDQKYLSSFVDALPENIVFASDIEDLGIIDIIWFDSLETYYCCIGY